LILTNLADQATNKNKEKNNRLDSIRNANFSNKEKERTPRMEDYLEVIYELVLC
jgi:hypothetical protein